MRSSRSIRKASRETVAAARAIGEELRKSQLHFSAFPKAPQLADLPAADASPVPLALLSRGGVFLSVSPSLFRLFDAAPPEVLQKPLTDLLQLRDHGGFFKLLTSCLQTAQSCRAQFSIGFPARARKDVLLVISPAPPLRSGPGVFYAAFVDLEDIEPRELGPRPPQQNTRLIEAIDGIVWEADYPRQFTYVSSQAERILGFSPRDWIRDPDFWRNHIHRDDRERVLHARAEALQTPAAHVLEYRMIAANRKTIWVKDSAVVLAGAPGWTRMCGIITDVTDLESAREDLRRANQNLEAAVAERTARMEQSLDAMETLCYGIAHDLKAPIRGLQGFIGLLTTDYHDKFDKDARMYAQRCQTALKHMSSLIEAILAYGRLNHTVPELIPINPRHVIDRVLNTLEPEITKTGAKIHLQLTFPRLIGNPYLLEQVFTNLIGNALKFVPRGARPEISISATEMEPASPQSRDREGALLEAEGRALSPSIPHPSNNPSIHPSSSPIVRLTVTDNGIGIPPGAAKRLFGMFQKLHRPEEYAGTGIGLAVVKRAVELMNGRVGLFSHPGHGSSFWIELPAAS